MKTDFFQSFLRFVDVFFARVSQSHSIEANPKSIDASPVSIKASPESMGN